MRAASAALSAVLPLSPILVYITMSTYPRLLLYAFAGLVGAVGAAGAVRGRGAGGAGLLSAAISMILLVLSSGYMPYFTGLSLGYVESGAGLWLAIAIGLSLYAYFLGSVYDVSARMASRMKELGYDRQSLSEVDVANAFIIAMGALAFAASTALALALIRIRSSGLAPLTALIVFVSIYLVAMAIGRVRRGDSA